LAAPPRSTRAAARAINRWLAQRGQPAAPASGGRRPTLAHGLGRVGLSAGRVAHPRLRQPHLLRSLRRLSPSLLAASAFGLLLQA
jgi:hypothetical protein